MPRISYNISGVMKDVDGSTSLTTGLVRVYDVTLGEEINGVVGSDGSISMDLANLKSAWANNHKLQVVIYSSDGAKSTEFRHTVDDSQAGYDAGTLYMHWTKPILRGTTLQAVIVTNKHDSAEYTVDFYDRDSDNKILSVDVSPNTSFSPHLLFRGLIFAGGICVVRESDAANVVEVQTVVK